MKSSTRLILLGMICALPAGAAAAESGATRPDTSKWLCKSCPKAAQGWSGSVDVGAGDVSNSSYKFGEYNGLGDQGGYFIGDLKTRYRGSKAYYWNIDASNLGLDSRSLNAEGGRQGRYKLDVKYDEIPHLLYKGAQTPFIGSGGASLTLPAGYPATSTAAMPLAGTLNSVDLSTQRKRLTVGGSWLAARNWEYSVKFTHETKDGMRRTAGAFFVNTAQLIEPIDYVTDQVDASASYTGPRTQVRFDYYGSKFRNGNDSLTWQNPYFVPATPGAVSGQLSLPPDNQFHQFLVSAGYQISDRNRVSADIAWGRMTQNQGFLASTLNAGLAVPSLPSTSADASATTLDGNIKFSSLLTKRLRLHAIYTHHNRDDQTPQYSYPSVSTDMFLGMARTNLPYSFTQDRTKLGADYRFTSRTRFAAGYDYDHHKRTFQEVDTTHEDTVWGQISTRALDKFDVSLKLAHGARRGSSYQAVPDGIQPPENPLLRKYYMANRDRDSAVLRVDFAASETVNVSFGAESNKDDYSDSAIGLTSGRDLSMNADVSWIVSDRTNLHAFATREEIKSAQSGSETFSVPDWTAQNKDTIDTLGIGVKHAVIKGKLNFSADYTMSRSKSDVVVNTGASNSGFPRLSSSLDSLKLYADYRMKPNVSLLGGYWFERYDTRNWMLDGVTPGTIPNVLTLGEQSPRYHVNVVKVAVRYRF